MNEISTQTQPRGLALRTMDDAMRFATLVASSEFAPKDFKGKPESCLLAIQHGSEVGLSPMQSLQSIAVINGRPTIWGDAALALVQSSPVCEYVTEQIEGDGDQVTAVCTAKRRGYPQPTVVRFSMADAKRAGLIGKAGPWAQYPARMLALRARGFALRNAFADCLRGLVTAEEAQDYQSFSSGGNVPSCQPAPAIARGATPGPEGEPPLAGQIAVYIANAQNDRTLKKMEARIDSLLSDNQITAAEWSRLTDMLIDHPQWVQREEVANG